MLDIKTAIKIEGVNPDFKEMDRVHSGLFSIWNEYREDLDTVKLKPPIRGLKSERRSDGWYWVVGCTKCLDPSSSKFNYHVCDYHDRCLDCGCDRSEILEVPMGVRGGWKCQPCFERERALIRNEALQKVADKGRYVEMDYRYTDEVVCPHCETVNEFDIEHVEPERCVSRFCHVCDGEFSVEFTWSIHYTTKVVGDRLLPDEV